jgi:hypothetical protein
MKKSVSIDALAASLVILLLAAIILSAGDALSYPPAVGISGNSENCLSCHVDNGPWKDDEMTIVDILDKATGKSLRQRDGSFLIEVQKGETRNLVTVLGRKAGDTAEPPQRNAWVYVDKSSSVLSRFPSGWETNIQYSCRVIGDMLEGFEGARITAAPMTIKANNNATDAELDFQAMITKGMSVKGNAKEGLVGNFLTRKIHLKVAK